MHEQTTGPRALTSEELQLIGGGIELSSPAISVTSVSCTASQAQLSSGISSIQSFYSAVGAAFGAGAASKFAAFSNLAL